jgi:hypothetical protein
VPTGGAMPPVYRRDEWSSFVIGLAARDVVAGAEGASLAGEEDHADGVVHLALGQDLDEVAFDLRRQAVEALRLVEGDGADARVVEGDFETPKRACLHCLSPCALNGGKQCCAADKGITREESSGVPSERSGW